MSDSSSRPGDHSLPGRLSLVVAPASFPGGIDGLRVSFETQYRLTANFAHATPAYLVVGRHDGGQAVDRRDAAPAAVLLHGELYGNDGPAPREALAAAADRLLREDAETVARNLRGSFVLLACTPSGLSLVTDRVASRKIFRCVRDGLSWLDTELASFDRQPVDPAGVASLLINRFIAAGRTLRAGVENVRRACVHRYDGASWTAVEYWQYAFADVDEKRFAAEIDARREELWRLITRAIRRRLPERGTLLLSLSGGVDSRAVLAALLEIGFPLARITTASYGDADDDDAVVASELASSLGLPWQLIPGSEDLERLLAVNAMACDGQVFFYPRGLDGYGELASTLAQPVTAFVGDECYGWTDHRLATRQDVFTIGIGLRAPASVPSYYSYGAHRHDVIEATLQSDIDALDRRYADVSSLHDLKDLLYLDQRLSNMLLPWRERHTGRCVRVANAHIDEDILDFMQGVPTAYRLDKQLFRETARKRFGQFQKVRFARSGGCSNDFLDQLFLRYFDAIDHQLGSTSSMLDDVLPPEVIRAGLASMCADIALRRAGSPALLAVIERRLRSMKIRWRFARERSGKISAQHGPLGFMSMAPIQMATVLQLRRFLQTDPRC
jgi:asparagine synthase (glutamine-hydrolysing)